jgi:glycosyltransferase involved in cell wall biosynthesis
MGGMQEVAVRIIRELDANSAIVLLKRGQLDDQLHIQKYYLDLPKAKYRAKRLWQYNQLARKIAAVIDMASPNVVVAFGYSMLVLGALSIFKAHHKPCFVPSIRNSVRELKQEKRAFPDLVRFATRYALRKADIVTTVSEAIAEEVISLGLDRGKVRVIYNGLDMTSIRQRANEPVNHPWIHEEIPIIVSVGRLSQQKNYPLLLDAINLVRQKMRVRLWLIGDGDERLKLKSMAQNLGLEEDIFFWGFQENPFKFVARSSVFALPSLYEGFPNVLIQAMAVGVPVISTDCPTGPSEIISHGHTGLLIPLNDTQAMADVILNVILDQRFSRSLAINASSVVERFDFSKTLRMFQEAIDGITGGGI